MAIVLQVGDEIFQYPETGSINYGEDATGWAEAVTDALKTVFGPGDIKTTETTLAGTSGNVSGLNFNTSFVQRILVEGQLKREFSSAPTKTESVTIEGSFNGTDFNIAVRTAGDDTQVEFDVDASGQFTYTSATVADTTSVTFKFKASAIIDVEAL